MTILRIGGVPEHFNYPWKLALEQQLFSNQNINLIWKDFPGGTGAMSAALKSNEIDLALLLTEGAVKEIASGAPFKIVCPFVESPLTWGIHAGKKEYNLSKLTQYLYAVSRLGSGSHIMACVHAKMHQVQLQNSQIVIANNIEGARDAIKSGRADLFFWEKFMTKPLVDSGEFFLVDQIPTPWPCFMLIANKNYMKDQGDTVELTIKLLHHFLKNLDNIVNLAEQIAYTYKLELTDVKSWLKLTKWSVQRKIKKEDMENVIKSLTDTGLLGHSPAIEDLVFDPDYIIK